MLQTRRFSITNITIRTEAQLRTLLLTLLTLNILDYALTQHILLQGGGEWNPLMEPLAHTIYMPILKLACVPLFILYLWLRRDVLLKRTYLQVLVRVALGAYMGVMVYYMVGFPVGLFY